MRSSPQPADGKPEPTFERLTLNQRIQHGVLVVSFTTLVVTGLPVRYHDTPWAGWLFALMGGPAGRALLHRLTALVLMALSAYHIGYLLFSRSGNEALLALVPRLQDGRDARHHILYYVGLRQEPPRFGRFNYIEKFEYLAVVWGTFIMALTGLLLWFEVQAMLALPKWVLDVCRVVHGYEAVLAFLAIIIWHLYCVHLNPDVFPMSRVWLDGRITESQMKHHHPLEYEEILGREETARRAQVAVGPERAAAAANDGAKDGEEAPAPAAVPTGKGEAR